MTDDGHVHVVGAGLAGLTAAVALAGQGRRVALYEAGPQAGGRCRSFFDSELGCRIDNGNHLLLAGNEAALDYLRRIGALGTLEGPADPVLPFVDIATGERWVLRPNRGPVPWWIFRTARRVPGTRAFDYLGALKLGRAAATATVGDMLGRERVLFRRLWQPLAVAALNTGVEQASARLFGTVLTQTLGRGGAACQPLVPRGGLSETFVDPALATLRACGGEIRFGARLKGLCFEAERVCELIFDEGAVGLGAGDTVVLAVPAAVAGRLVPGLEVPDAFAPIVNAHFRCPAPEGAPLFLGIVGGTAEWVFRKREVVSVTVSAADRIADQPAEVLRDLLWRDVALAYGMASAPVPPARIVKERRATFLASPEQLRRRPLAVTRWRNLLLAGDYCATGLPATIEGAIRSGFAAAACVMNLRPGGQLNGARATHVAAAAAPTGDREQQRALP
jgi:hydroxysqualene dehydroxylase